MKPDPKKAKEAYQQGVRAEKAQDWETAYTAYSDAVNWAPNDRGYFLRREIAKSGLVQSKWTPRRRTRFPAAWTPRAGNCCPRATSIRRTPWCGSG